MVVVNNGLNRLASLLNTDLYSSVTGTSQQVVSITDTDLIAEDTAVEALVSGGFSNAVLSSNTITITYTIPSNLGNGSTFYEWGTRINSDSTLLDRAISAGVVKNTNREIVRITTYEISQWALKVLLRIHKVQQTT